jgi:tetratricopeptide (TPR) repeat protein
MKFYFCETCGRRITDEDLDKGEGRNKQLKGVFCKGCAAGVMTLEFDALSLNSLKKNEQPGNAPQPEPAANPHVATTRRKPAVSHGNPVQKNESPALLIAGIGAVILVVVAVLVFSRPAPKPIAERPQRAPAVPSAKVETAVPVQSARPVDPAPTVNALPPIAELQAPESKIGGGPDAVVPEPVPNTTSPTLVSGDPAPEDSIKAVPRPAPIAQVPPPVIEKNELPPLFSNEQRDTLAVFDAVFVLLSKADTEGALSAAQCGPAPVAQQLAAVLKKGLALHPRAVQALNQNPPANPVRIKSGNTVMNGTIVRVDERNAWIREKGIELPVKLGALPPEVFIDALKLDDATPERAIEKAQYLFSLGNFDGAAALTKKIDTEKYPDAALINLRGKLEELRRFDEALKQVEAAVKALDAGRARNLTAEVARNFPELSAVHKQRIDDLRSRAENATLSGRIKKLFSGKLTRADPDLYVEVTYNHEQGADAWADFEGDGWTAEAGGMHTRKFPYAKTLYHKARFQSKTLRLEAVITDHDIIHASLGYAQLKIRWVGAGQILFAYEPKFTGNDFAGERWPHPAAAGELRYIVERTPTQLTFQVDGKEYYRKDISALRDPNDKPWNVGINSKPSQTYIREIVIKGHLDPEWLKHATEADGEKRK